MRLPYINKIFYTVFNFLRSTTYGLIGQEQIDNKGNTHSYRSYHYDQQGNTILLTDEQTKIKASYSYDPYGQTLKHEGEHTAYRYSGKHGIQTDQNDLLYMRARYYDPSSKRFLGQDILLGNIQEIKSLNRYAYVQGNPMKYIDPTGLHPFEGGSYEGDSNSYNKRGDILGHKGFKKT